VGGGHVRERPVHDVLRRRRSAGDQPVRGRAGGGGAPVQRARSPEAVARQVAQLRDAMGAGVLDLILYNDALRHKRARESVRLFGTEVIPRARDL
jgi:hypothetical protein